ncbi:MULTISPECIES: hypothetical protein [Parasutterella]|jgi:uncharacterized protein YdaU (DUF1376 family)|uniref:hypothetical protein n=1 Tax=Parasutterella TaxID=577310 RepID=UPI0026DCC5BB|nr:hypothetical protein [Parasutterella excrementihominis]
MSKSNQFESPCYFLSAEEYTQDYLSLPEPQLACLFKLRSAYALKGSPLSEDDIEGLYPVYTPVHEKTLGKVLNKFFTKKGDVFIDIRIESQIEKRKEHQLNIEQLIEKEVQKRVARALAGMKGGLKRVQNLKTRGLPVQVEDDSDAIVGQAEKTQYPDEEVVFKQSTSKTQANDYQNSSDSQANAKQILSKGQANLKQILSKPQANTKQNPSKVVANSDFATAKESQLVDFQEKLENLSNAPEFESEAGPALAHVCASDNPISDNFLINKKNKNKSESVSESVKEKTENFKNQNSREIEKFSTGKKWTLQEAKTLLVDSGLDQKFLEAWVSRSDRNQTRFNALFSEVLPRFDQEAFDQLIARCKEQKRSEGAMFSGSIAYVISALERETVTVKTRRKKKNSERDYTEGLIQNPDGSWSPDPNYVPKKKKYSDRDWTEGLIKNPDGSYSLDPNYEH